MAGGVMTSVRLRLVLSFSFGDLLLGCGRGVSQIVLVVISGYLLLDFPHVYHAKTSSFCTFSDKIFATDPKIAPKKRRKNMVFATLSQKRYQEK